uniref:Cystatin domain-containing protein n=1 Tax=Trichobilharzia regenti TaxID=157069 RepID=A0AA85KH30_TRIRE|nr:unnamed protein product [Trichobilharzia regenti]
MKFPSVACFFFLTVTLLQSCLSRKLIGGKQPVENVNSDKMRKAVESAVLAYNQQANSKQWFTDVEVKNAKTQVVSGKQYQFDLHLKPSKCDKKETMTQTKNGNKVHCKANADAEGVVCTAKVVHQPWRKVQYKATLSKCHSDKTPKKVGKESQKHDGKKKHNNNKPTKKH